MQMAAKQGSNTDHSARRYSPGQTAGAPFGLPPTHGHKPRGGSCSGDNEPNSKSWIFEVICWPLRFTDSWPRLVSGSSSKKQLYHLFMATGSQGPQPWIKSAGRWQTSPSNRFPLRMRIEPLRLSSTIEFHDVEQTLRRSLFAQGFLRREIRLWLWIFHFISPRHKICVNFENLP